MDDKSTAKSLRYPAPDFLATRMFKLVVPQGYLGESGWTDPHCAHRTSTVSPCAFCEQEGHLAAPSPSFQDRFLISLGGCLADPLLCASNEHLLSVRVARAREINRLPSPPLSCGSLPASHAGSDLPASNAPLPHFLNP